MTFRGLLQFKGFYEIVALILFKYFITDWGKMRLFVLQFLIFLQCLRNFHDHSHQLFLQVNCSLDPAGIYNEFCSHPR